MIKCTMQLLLFSKQTVPVALSGLGHGASASSCCLDYFEHSCCFVSISCTSFSNSTYKRMITIITNWGLLASSMSLLFSRLVYRSNQQDIPSNPLMQNKVPIYHFCSCNIIGWHIFTMLTTSSRSNNHGTPVRK